MNVLIVDDEPLARDRLKRMVNDTQKWRVVAEAANGQEAVALCDHTQPDVILMDVRMPKMDGVTAAKQIAQAKNAPAIIFCTAYNDYGVDAINAQAAGYLLKPVRQENLLIALEKARQVNKLQLMSLEAANDSDCSLKQRAHITSRSRRGIQMVPLEEIRVFLADHKYVTAYHSGGEILIDDTLKELAAEYPDKLLRIHRNALVALRHVQGMERNEDGVHCVRLTEIDHLPPVSRRHLPKVRKLLQNL